jgi:hypothetical protein
MEPHLAPGPGSGRERRVQVAELKAELAVDAPLLAEGQGGASFEQAFDSAHSPRQPPARPIPARHASWREAR